MDLSFQALAPDYAHLLATMEVRADWVDRIDLAARRILKLKRRFQVIERLTGVPWVEPALQCLRESDLDLTCHLHNGDPLTGWTRHDPPHRPLKGAPPFSFEASAADALAYDRISEMTDWSPERIAFALETVNGFGARLHGIHSGYLWSGTLHYRKGKYIRDHVFDPEFIDKQPGVMPVLKRLMDLDPSIRFGALIKTGAPRITDTIASHPIAAKALVTSATALVAVAPPALALLPPAVPALLVGAALGAGALALVDLGRRHHHLAGLAG